MSEIPGPEGVTRLLVEWQNGNQDALEHLIPLVYRELRAIADRYLARELPVTRSSPPRSSTRPTSS